MLLSPLSILKTLYVQMSEKRPALMRIIRFVISGGTATIVNLCILFLLTRFLGIWYLYSSILAFAASFFVSFTLQKFWTFSETSRDRMHSQAALFLSVMLFALTLNTVLIFLFVEFAESHYLLAQLASGILIAFINFFSYKHFVFSEHTRDRTWDSPSWPHVALIALAIGTFFIVSLYHLAENPPTWLDEGTNIQAAMNLAEKGASAIQIGPEELISSDFLTTSFTVTYPIAIAFSLLQTDILVARAMMVAFMALAVLFAYLLMARLSGTRKYAITLSSLFLLITFAPLYGHGKNVLGEVPGLMFFLASLYLLHKAESVSSWRLFSLAGIAAGLAMSTKPLYLLIIAPATALLFALKYREISIRGMLAFTVSAAAILAAWFFIHLGHLGALKEILFAANAEDATLAARLARTTSQFISELQPMYFLGLLGIWYITLAARWRKKITIDTAELYAALFSAMNLGLYLMSRGFYRYFFPAEVLALIFLPLALLTYPVRERHRGLMRMASFSLITALILFQAYQTLFSSWVSQSLSSTRSAQLEQHLAALPTESSIFLYNVPEAAIFVPSRNYYQYLRYGNNVIRGEENLPILFEGVPDFVLVDLKFTDTERVLPFYSEMARFDKYTLYRKATE